MPPVVTYTNYMQPLKELVIALGRGGLPVHRPTLAAAQRRMRKEILDLQDELDDAVGFHVNTNSDDVNYLLYDYLLLPMPKVRGEQKDTADDQTISNLKLNYKLGVLDSILDIRARNKILSTYLVDSKFRLAVDPEWASFHYQYSLNTDTLRLACKQTNRGDGGNVQNFPKRKGVWVRDIVRAPPGMVLLACDLRSAELWTTALAAQSNTLLNDLYNDLDIHQLNGEAIYNGLDNQLKDYINRTVPDPIKRAKLIRTCGKHLGHAWDYGAGIGVTVRTIHHLIGVKPSQKQAELARDGYFCRIPELRSYHQDIQTQLYTTGFLRTAYGTSRRFHSTLPRHGTQSGNEAVFHAAYAHIPQSTVGIYTNRLMLRCAAAGLTPGKFLRAQIHDELLFLVPEKEVEQVTEAIAGCNTECIPGSDVIIPLEFAAGPSWGSLKTILTQSPQRPTCHAI